MELLIFELLIDDGCVIGGGVKLLSPEPPPLCKGDNVPLVGGRMGEDCVGDNWGTWDKRAPSGESGVLHRSLDNRARKKNNIF